MSTCYLTTTLPYVNADPHIGFALEIVQADAYARYRRLMGDAVFFNTGTDEHGQKIAQKADEAGRDRQDYVDHYAGRVKKLRESLNLSYDAFIRTTDPAHKAAAQELWRRCAAAGDIYKKTYRGLYCVGHEAFLKESELVEGRCPEHPSEAPQDIEEENYFFALSKYQAHLEEYLAKPGVIVPEWRREEALNFVKRGLEDFSISRKRSRMDWGVPVPDDDEHIMYVWFDALTNYISTLGWPEDRDGRFKKFWVEGKTLQMAGKDQVRFQSIMWQAMLKSAGVPATDCVLYHGFITSGGQKMSKSLGNVISPYDVVEKYGIDATRYILLRHVHPFEDSDLTWERMHEYYTAHLVKGIGNLCARIMKMAETHLDAPVEPSEDTIPQEWKDAFARFAFNEVADIVWEKIGALDERIQETEPFKLVKEDKEAAEAVIAELALELYTIGRMLNPLMPETSAKIKDAVRANTMPEPLFPRKD